MKRFEQLVLMKNDDALPFLFLTPKSTTKVKFDSTDITGNQNKFFEAATGKQTQLFSSVTWPDPKLINISGWDGGWMQYTKKDKAKEGRVIFNFKPQTDDSYYLELPGDIDNDSISLTVNGNSINTDVRDQNSRLINLGSRQRGQTIHVVFTLKNNQLNLNAANLWCLNTKQLEQIMDKFKQKQPQFKQKNLEKTNINVIISSVTVCKYFTQHRYI